MSIFKISDEKKKSAKQLKREKELADAKDIEEFARKQEQELEDAKGKAKAEETTEEIDEKSAENKEKLKAIKYPLELHEDVDRVQNAVMSDMFRQWHQGLKSGGNNSPRFKCFNLNH